MKALGFKICLKWMWRFFKFFKLITKRWTDEMDIFVWSSQTHTHREWCLYALEPNTTIEFRIIDKSGDSQKWKEQKNKKTNFTIRERKNIYKWSCWSWRWDFVIGIIVVSVWFRSDFSTRVCRLENKKRSQWWHNTRTKRICETKEKRSKRV